MGINPPPNKLTPHWIHQPQRTHGRRVGSAVTTTPPFVRGCCKLGHFCFVDGAGGGGGGVGGGGGRCRGTSRKGCDRRTKELKMRPWSWKKKHSDFRLGCSRTENGVTGAGLRASSFKLPLRTKIWTHSAGTGSREGYPKSHATNWIKSRPVVNRNPLCFQSSRP